MGQIRISSVCSSRIRNDWKRQKVSRYRWVCIKNYWNVRTEKWSFKLRRSILTKIYAWKWLIYCLSAPSQNSCFVFLGWKGLTSEIKKSKFEISSKSHTSLPSLFFQTQTSKIPRLLCLSIGLIIVKFKSLRKSHRFISQIPYVTWSSKPNNFWESYAWWESYDDFSSKALKVHPFFILFRSTWCVNHVLSDNTLLKAFI